MPSPRSASTAVLRKVVLALLVLLGVSAVLLAPFLLLTPRPPPLPREVRGTAALEAALASLTAAGTPPALEVLAVRDGEVLFSRALGTADGPAGRPAAVGDVYHLWSVTKLFTATAVLQLAEEGRLGLDEPVARYLPELRLRGPDGTEAAVTIRQLLSHTAGMRDLSPLDLLGWVHHPGDQAPLHRELVATRLGPYQRLAAAPGGPGAYSNAGYIVLGAVLEAATGLPYEEVVRQRVLEPLRLEHTGFAVRPGLEARAVAGTHPLFHGFTPLLVAIHPDWFGSWVTRVEDRRMWLRPMQTDYTSPTGLLGTAGDLARFGQAWLQGGELEGGRILGAATVRQALEEGFGGPTGPDRDRMGLGWHWWSDVPRPFKGHGGEGPGFGAQLALFPEQRLVVVVLGNDTLIDRVGLASLVASAVP